MTGQKKTTKTSKEIVKKAAEQFRVDNEKMLDTIERMRKDVEAIKLKYGEYSGVYGKQKLRLELICLYQENVVKYVEFLERSCYLNDLRIMTMAKSFRKVTDMKVQEVMKLTDSEIRELATVKITQ